MSAVLASSTVEPNLSWDGSTKVVSATPYLPYSSWASSSTDLSYDAQMGMTSSYSGNGGAVTCSTYSLDTSSLEGIHGVYFRFRGATYASSVSTTTSYGIFCQIGNSLVKYYFNRYISPSYVKTTTLSTSFLLDYSDPFSSVYTNTAPGPSDPDMLNPANSEFSDIFCVSYDPNTGPYGTVRLHQLTGVWVLIRSYELTTPVASPYITKVTGYLNMAGIWYDSSNLYLLRAPQPEYYGVKVYSPSVPGVVNIFGSSHR